MDPYPHVYSCWLCNTLTTSICSSILRLIIFDSSTHCNGVGTENASYSHSIVFSNLSGSFSMDIFFHRYLWKFQYLFYSPFIFFAALCNFSVFPVCFFLFYTASTTPFHKFWKHKLLCLSWHFFLFPLGR